MTGFSIRPESVGGELLSDEEVVRRVTAGDTPLFEILMRRYNQRLYRAVRGILQGEPEIEDVMQQAWMNAFVHLAQFEERAKFSTWLTRIAVHEALGRLRKRRPFVSTSILENDEVGTADLESPLPDPEMKAIGEQLRQALESAIASLPERYRLVVILRQVEGVSTSETAAILGVSEDVIKTRLHRARAMMKEQLMDRAEQTSSNLFGFGDHRCDRMVSTLFERVAML